MVLGRDQGEALSRGGRAEVGPSCSRKDSYRRLSKSTGDDCGSVRGREAVREEYRGPMSVLGGSCRPSAQADYLSEDCKRLSIR